MPLKIEFPFRKQNKTKQKKSHKTRSGDYDKCCIRTILFCKIYRCIVIVNQPLTYGLHVWSFSTHRDKARVPSLVL